MSQKGLAPILIILLIALGIGGYLVYSGKTNLPQKQVAQTAKSDASPVPTGIGETTNWKTYTNTEYGFSFLYPPAYSIAESNSKFITLKREIIKDYHIYLSAFVVKDELYDQYLYASQVNSFRTEDTNLDSKKAKKIFWKGEVQDGSDSYLVRVITGDDKILYIIQGSVNSHNQTKIDELTQEYNQMLSTFKFQ